MNVTLGETGFDDEAADADAEEIELDVVVDMDVVVDTDVVVDMGIGGEADESGGRVYSGCVWRKGVMVVVER